MPKYTVVPVANVPAAGNPASAMDTAIATVAGTDGKRFTKPAGYTCIEFAPIAGLAGTYSLHKYWQDTGTWRQEGPRGSTPATFDPATPADAVPIRISTETAEGYYAVVLMTGAGTTTAELYPQFR